MALLIARRKPCDRLRVFLDSFFETMMRVGIEVHPVVAVVDPADVLVRIDPRQLGREADGVDVAEHAVGLSAHQHLLAQVRLEVRDRDLLRVDLGELGESREQLQRAVVRGAAERLALEILRRS